MNTSGKQARCWCGRGLLALLIVLLTPEPPAPAGAQPLPAPWDATGIMLADPAQPLCFDAAQAHVIFVNEAAGTVAYNWGTGQRWVVNERRFAVCGPQGLLFAATPTGAWRFSLADPVGQPSAHLPTAWAADGTRLVYAVNFAGEASDLWVSPDGGLVWEDHPFPLLGQGEALLVSTADAQALYVVFGQEERTPFYTETQHRWYFSPDAGRSWQSRSGILNRPDLDHFGLAILPSRATPVNEVVRLNTPYATGQNCCRSDVDLSPDGGLTYHSAGVVGWYDDVQIVHTVGGLLRYNYHADPGTANYQQHLAFSTDEGLTWEDRPLPAPPPASLPALLVRRSDRPTWRAQCPGKRLLVYRNALVLLTRCGR